MVSEYTGLNIKEVDEIELFEFWLYLRDAVIYKYMKTEDGRKYLENCWRVEQTKPDRQAIRRRMEKD